ncbi:hypothetical protein [Mesorhizobium sp. M4B.F.Ca.ET.150.01.1.1]
MLMRAVEDLARERGKDAM